MESQNINQYQERKYQEKTHSADIIEWNTYLNHKQSKTKYLVEKTFLVYSPLQKLYLKATWIFCSHHRFSIGLRFEEFLGHSICFLFSHCIIALMVSDHYHAGRPIHNPFCVLAEERSFLCKISWYMISWYNYCPLTVVKSSSPDPYPYQKNSPEA